MSISAEAPPRRRRAQARSKHAPSRRLRLHVRALAHTLVVIAGWALLLGFWIRAVLNTGPAALLGMLRLVAVTLAVVLVVTLLWVAHNVSIYRRKGPRRGALQVDELFTHDFVGRPLAADWHELQTAEWVRVRITEDRKQYEAGGARTGAEPPAEAPAEHAAEER